MVVTKNRPAAAGIAGEESSAVPPPPTPPANHAGGSADRRQKRADRSMMKGVECKVPARHFIDHSPKDPNCPICNDAKYQKLSRRRKMVS